MKILHTDGGCSFNGQKDISKRKMVSVVSDEQGKVLIDKHVEGGSNNIAELLAVKEALLWCVVNGVDEVEIRTDSKNNLAWVNGKEVGKNINDRATVMYLKTAINAVRQDVKLNLIWIPREKNLAGFYIEEKYKL